MSAENIIERVFPSQKEQEEYLENEIKSFDERIPRDSSDRLLQLVQNAKESHLPQGKPSAVEISTIIGRLQLLKYHARVKTAAILSGSEYNPEVYVAIRNVDLADAAKSLARAGNLEAIQILLRCHPYTLIPHVFKLLSNIPETVSANEVEPLLRFMVETAQFPPAISSKTDWMETESMCIFLRQGGYHEQLMATEHLSRLNYGWIPPTLNQISDWIYNRVIDIEARTGQFALALEFVSMGKKVLSNAGGEIDCLNDISEALDQMKTLIGSYLLIKHASAESERRTISTSDLKDHPITTKLHWRLDLADFIFKNKLERMRWYLCSLEEENPGLCRKGIRTVLHSICRSEDPPYQLLRLALEAEINNSRMFSWIVGLFNAELDQPSCIFGEHGVLSVVQNAFDVLYACNSLDSWNSIQDFLARISEAVSFSEMGDDNKAAIHNRLQIIGTQIAAAKLLCKHGIPITLGTVRDSSQGEIENKIKILIARFSRSEPSEKAWKLLISELEDLSDHGFSLLPKESMKAIYCKGLLNAGLIELAGMYLSTFDEHNKYELVLSTARETFYSSSIANDENIQAAKSMIALLPKDSCTEREIRFMDAIAQLKVIGIDLPPLKLYQASAEERTYMFRDAIKSVLANDENSLGVDSLADLSLGLETKLGKNDILIMVAESALKKGNTKLSEEIAIQLSNASISQGYCILVQTAMKTDSDYIRKRLLSYAIRYAPLEDLLKLLSDWKEADGKIMSANFLWDFSLDAMISGNWLTSSSEAAAYIDYIARKENKHIECDSHHENLDSEITYNFENFAILECFRGLAYDDLIIWSCLMALEPQKQHCWIHQILDDRMNYSRDFLKRASIVSILASSMGILLAANFRGEDIFCISMEQLILNCISIISVDIERLPESDSIGKFGNNGTTIQLKQNYSLDWYYELQEMLFKSLQALSCLVKETRILSLLPDEVDNDIWNHGDISAQKEIVLSMARRASALARGNRLSSEGGGSQKNVDLIGSAKGWRMLERSLELSTQCGMSSYEIKLEYFVSIFAEDAPYLQFQDSVALVWPEIIEAEPERILGILLFRLHSLLRNMARATDIPELCWFIRRCQDCCDILHKFPGKSAVAKGPNLYGDIQNILQSLGSSLHNFEKRNIPIDARFLLIPVIDFLHQNIPISDINNNINAMDDTLAQQLRRGVLENLTHVNFDEVAAAVKTFGELYKNIQTAFLTEGHETPTSPTGETILRPFIITRQEIIAALTCQELSSLALTEEMQEEKRLALEKCFLLAGPQLAMQLVAFSCLGNQAPFELQIPCPLLSTVQIVAVLDIFFECFDVRKMTAAVTSSIENDVHKIMHLNREIFALIIHQRARLGALQELDSLSGLTENHTSRCKDSVLLMLEKSAENNGDIRMETVTHALQDVLSTGIDFELVVKIAYVFKNVFAWVNILSEKYSTPFDIKSKIKDAVNCMVQHSLQILGGEQANSDITPGEAFQNIYGIIRCLDTENPSIEARYKESIKSTHLNDSIDVFPLLQSCRTDMYVLLFQHALKHTSGPQESNSAVIAECQVQLLEIISALGSSIWRTWTIPEGFDPSSLNRSEVRIYNRAAAALALSGWQKAFQELDVNPDNFSSIKSTKESILKMAKSAESKSLKEMEALLEMLMEIFVDIYPCQEVEQMVGTASIVNGNRNDIGSEQEQKILIHPLHECWAAVLGNLVSIQAFKVSLKGFDKATEYLVRGCPYGNSVALLTEEETKCFLETIAKQENGNFWAAIFGQILPYENLRLLTYNDFLHLPTPSIISNELQTCFLSLSIAVCLHGYLPETQKLNPRLFSEILNTILQKESHYRYKCLLDPTKIEGLPNISMRSLVACFAAASLAIAKSYDTSLWIAMEHAGIHPLLRIASCGPLILDRFLEWGCSLDRSMLQGIEIQNSMKEAILIPYSIARMLNALPEQAVEALTQLKEESVL